MITPSGPVFLTHSATTGEANISFRYGHVIRNRDAHPAARFYLALHEAQRPRGFKDNFIVDRGGQWPELFRAAAMVPDSLYCVALSGMLNSVPETRHAEIKEALHATCKQVKTP